MNPILPEGTFPRYRYGVPHFPQRQAKINVDRVTFITLSPKDPSGSLLELTVFPAGSYCTHKMPRDGSYK
jgi:hypothetical protein